MTIWEQLAQQARETKKAFTVLAPMEDVTDTVFRQIIMKTGRPDLFFTEFTSSDGICSKGKPRVARRLEYTSEEKPLIAQIWGKRPENIAKTVEYVLTLGFDGIDINMGCPQKKVVQHGSGGGLIKNPELALEIIAAAQDVIKKSATPLPLSVKTRIGFKTIDLSWIEKLLSQDLAALTVHVRTVDEQSAVPAHWELMQEIVALRDKLAPQTVLIGNGDITTKEQLDTYYDLYGVEGVMVGRGIFANPWLFSKNVRYDELRPAQKIAMYAHHISLFIEKWGKNKNFELLKKFAKAYIKDFEGAPELRAEILPLKTAPEILDVLTKAEQQYV